MERRLEPEIDGLGYPARQDYDLLHSTRASVGQ
jgi:hypothetical protein